MAARRFTNLRVIAVWLKAFALTMIIILLWHELLMVFVVNTLGWGRYVVPLVHILYYCITGLIWVGFFVLHLEHLNRLARKGMLREAALVTLGAELLLIALGQAGLTVYGFLASDAPGLLLMAAEGLAGGGMLLYAQKLKTRAGKMDTAGRG